MNTCEATSVDLRQFCADEDSQYRMTEPWVSGGWCYATDGKICVRIPATGEADTPNPKGGGYPPTDGIFSPSKGETRRPWPDGPLFRGVEMCRQCYGKGKIGCEECGISRCLVCNGKGTYEQDIGRRVGGHLIAVRYDRMIRSLLNVQWITGSPPLSPLHFEFDRGEGRVMGLKPTAYSGW